MIKTIKDTTYILNGATLINSESELKAILAANSLEDKPLADYKKGTISYNILSSHNTSSDINKLKIRFDALVSHDITYVGIIQTARASGLVEFPVPYALTNCHNTLCAVGGTLNEDDHIFGFSAAEKYGGIYVPPHLAVIHSYAREELAGCGKMILGSDSHTRYGALGTLAVGEGGPEIVKQLLKHTYDVNYPDVVAVYLTGTPKSNVGPHDVALTLIKEVFESGFAKNKILEFVGPGVNNLSVDFRSGVDVMTTETTCLSSIWMTDEKVSEYFTVHGRPQDYKKLSPDTIAAYDGCVCIELDKIEPMVAMPFHPSNVYSIREFNQNALDILDSIEQNALKQFSKNAIKCDLKSKYYDGGFHVDQGIIAGCAGGIYENVMISADMLNGASCGNKEFSLSVYPGSQSIYLELLKHGAIEKLMESGAIIKTAFCGPCFGAGDVPANNAFSIRHTTRNFPNREGSKPSDGQISYVALMDARSITATTLNGGVLTGAKESDITPTEYNYNYNYNSELYKKRVYNGWGNPQNDKELILGPNIANWPSMIKMPQNLLINLASVIRDPVTTTDELIPSGETSTLRSNPYKLSEFTLSRKDPMYVSKAKRIRDIEDARKSGDTSQIEGILAVASDVTGNKIDANDISIGSAIFAIMPGDGSAREQAASCQKVLGGWANIAHEYATKRYRSNCINWGMVPFLVDDKTSEQFTDGMYIFVPNINAAIQEAKDSTVAYIIDGNNAKQITLGIAPMTQDERDILTSGGLINYYNR